MATQTFFVDTSILIAHLRQKPATILQKAINQYGEPGVSDAVVFELEVGAQRSGRMREFQAHFSRFQTYSLTQDILIEAAVIQANLLSSNQMIGLVDVFIAATAIHHNLPLLTLNIKHFQRVTALKLLPIP